IRAPAKSPESAVSKAASPLGTWRAGAIWLLQSALAAVLLTLLWQPVAMISELKPQQDIIAVLVDDSRSMMITEGGSTRLAQAVTALQDGTLTGLQKKFQTRLYRVDSQLARSSHF